MGGFGRRAFEADSAEWCAHHIAKHLKRSVDAQEGQSRSVEVLSCQIQGLERGSHIEGSGSVEYALHQIPMRPLGDDGDCA
ncbi:hypothetical protein ACFVQ9_20270 [Streptomyces goshikiensis]|uniref:hypothetical protein n=1 Tax=Streptomyces goshikiensis TaxID=1942 RepID=UPI0036C5019E